MKVLQGYPRSTEEEILKTVNRAGIAVILGPRGTGKTQLAVNAIRDRIFHTPFSALYITAADLFDSLRKDVADGGHGKTLRRFSQVGLLVIDELQESWDTKYEMTELTRLMDKRYSEMLPTILVSNLTDEGFRRRVGPSIVSRIQEGGLMLPCMWPSFRAQLVQ